MFIAEKYLKLLSLSCSTARLPGQPRLWGPGKLKFSQGKFIKRTKYISNLKIGVIYRYGKK
jgi:hypothetical protein